MGKRGRETGCTIEALLPTMKSEASKAIAKELTYGFTMREENDSALGAQRRTMVGRWKRRRQRTSRDDDVAHVDTVHDKR
ncbi:protein B4 isoform X1 [Sesbania bispinosa]|nr:protein B4 isoform X1 [Sesbania bispinosa]